MVFQAAAIFNIIHGRDYSLIFPLISLIFSLFSVFLVEFCSDFPRYFHVILFSISLFHCSSAYNWIFMSVVLFHRHLVACDEFPLSIEFGLLWLLPLFYGILTRNLPTFYSTIEKIQNLHNPTWFALKFNLTPLELPTLTRLLQNFVRLKYGRNQKISWIYENACRCPDSLFFNKSCENLLYGTDFTSMRHKKWRVEHKANYE